MGALPRRDTDQRAPRESVVSVRRLATFSRRMARGLLRIEDTPSGRGAEMGSPTSRSPAPNRPMALFETCGEPWARPAAPTTERADPASPSRPVLDIRERELGSGSPCGPDRHHGDGAFASAHHGHGGVGGGQRWSRRHQRGSRRRPRTSRRRASALRASTALTTRVSARTSNRTGWPEGQPKVASAVEGRNAPSRSSARSSRLQVVTGPSGRLQSCVGASSTASPPRTGKAPSGRRAVNSQLGAPTDGVGDDTSRSAAPDPSTPKSRRRAGKLVSEGGLEPPRPCGH